MNIAKDLYAEGLLHCQYPWVYEVSYLVYTGSVAYGISNETSDYDCYGITVPPKSMVFPYQAGMVPGFGTPPQNFEQYQEHHIEYRSKEYDFSIYNIVKFFNLAMDCNPNIIDVLFVPETCVLVCDDIGHIIRNNRKLFLHKGAWHRFRGYAYSQLDKLKKKIRESSVRAQMIEEFGYDLKYATHLVRLILEVEQIMVEGDLDLRRGNDVLRSIRRGEWKEEDVVAWFKNKEASLERLYIESTIPYKPDEDAIRDVLNQCLTLAYGKLDFVVDSRCEDALRQVKAIADQVLRGVR